MSHIPSGDLAEESADESDADSAPHPPTATSLSNPHDAHPSTHATTAHAAVHDTVRVPLIELDQVSVRHVGKVALQQVSLRLYPGEIVTVVGPNGSGKTTLLRAVLGAAAEMSGRRHLRPGARIGYVPQRLNIDGSLPLTVRRFLTLQRREPRALMRQRVATAADRAGIQGWLSQSMTSLSGGQFQRVLLARALLHQPDLLLLDEATQGLDQPGAAAFYQQIEAVRDDLGCAVLMVSHDLHVVMSASDRVICLNGHICCEGTPQNVVSAPEYRALFGSGTMGAMALYQHHHDHAHDPVTPAAQPGGNGEAAGPVKNV